MPWRRGTLHRYHRRGRPSPPSLSSWKRANGLSGPSNILSADRKELAPTLTALLEEGLVSEQYDVLGGDEVTETFAVTSEGLAWLKKFEEARDPANDNPEGGRSSLLFFAE